MKKLKKAKKSSYEKSVNFLLNYAKKNKWSDIASMQFYASEVYQIIAQLFDNGKVKAKIGYIAEYEDDNGKTFIIGNRIHKEKHAAQNAANMWSNDKWENEDRIKIKKVYTK